MAYYTYEQLVDKVDGGKTLYFVDADCNIVEFSFDGQYRIKSYNISKTIFDKTLTDEEFDKQFTYYLRHHKVGIKK